MPYMLRAVGSCIFPIAHVGPLGQSFLGESDLFMVLFWPGFQRFVAVKHKAEQQPSGTAALAAAVGAFLLSGLPKPNPSCRWLWQPDRGVPWVAVHRSLKRFQHIAPSSKKECKAVGREREIATEIQREINVR